MQFSTIALALAAATTAFAAPQPTVVLNSYRGLNCDQSTLTGDGHLVSPPAGSCTALSPQTNSVSVRVMAGEIQQGCTLELYQKPDCGADGQKVSYDITPAELDCKSGFFKVEDLARSAKVVCP